MTKNIVANSNREIIIDFDSLMSIIFTIEAIEKSPLNDMLKYSKFRNIQRLLNLTKHRIKKCIDTESRP